MITLKRLEATNFKGLSSVDLIFPPRGNILIEGYNEAGKSTLFEAVYVALYGKPLVGEDSRARQDEVIQYGQSLATVQLTFSVGPQELMVSRIFERGKSQRATLTIQPLGLQSELINRVRVVDERILKELGNLDGDSLRNSCFVEQKELGRIEALNRAQREQAIQRLLGLERLTKLMDEFKFRREQERELTLAEKYVTLACAQAEVHGAIIQEAKRAERLDAVKINSQVTLLVGLADQLEEAEELLRKSILRSHKASERLDHCKQIKEQMARCDQTGQQMTEVQHTRQGLRQVEEELVKLENIERVNLPQALSYLSDVYAAAHAVALHQQARKQFQEAQETMREAERNLQSLTQAVAEQQKRVEELIRAQARLVQRKEEAQTERERIVQRLKELDTKRVRLTNSLGLVGDWETANEVLRTIHQEINVAEAKEENLKGLQQEIQRREHEAHTIEAVVAQAEQEMQRAIDAARLATGYEALTAWIRLKGVEVALADYPARQSDLATKRQQAEVALANARMKTRTPIITGIALTVLALLAPGLGILRWPAFILAALLGVGAIFTWIWFFRARKAVRQQSNLLAQCDRDVQQVEMQRQAAIQAGGDPATLVHHEQQLQGSGIVIPQDLDAGRTLHEELRQKLSVTQGYHILQEAAQEARANQVRLAEQLRQARMKVDESKKALLLALQSGNPTEQIRNLVVRLAEQERIVAAAAQKARASLAADSVWPTSSSLLQTELSVCQADLRSVGAAQEQQAQNAATLIKEAETDKVNAESALQHAREVTSARQATDPAGQLSHAQELLDQELDMCRQREQAMQPLLQKIHVQTEAKVESEKGSAEEQVRALEKQLASRFLWQEKWRICKATLTTELTTALSMLEDLLTAANGLTIPELPSLPPTPSGADVALSYEQTLALMPTTIKAALEAVLNSLNERGARNILDEAFNEQGRIRQHTEHLEREIQNRRQAINAILLSRHITFPSTYTPAAIAACWPLTADCSPDEEEQVVESLDTIRKQLYAAQQREKQLIIELRHPGTPLSIEQCQQKVDKLTEEREICEVATKLLRETHDRIARRVLPITERNMQPLLQQLTNGRYRDVRLTPEDSNGQPGEMDYRVRVWDPTARRFVAKNLFSGGTRDQCSLALRLAFALATLPQELGVAPGFIFLDEPLSAFDAQRARALVELLTTGTIAQQFNQVVLISHYHAFDRNAFQYHVRMEAGQVAESDLPGLHDSALIQPQAIHVPL